jgi:hypothetical protein
MAGPMALSTRVDNIVLLLFAAGDGEAFNRPLSSVGRLHHLVYRLQADAKLWTPRSQGNRYVYLEDERGLYSQDFFDDLFALHALACLNVQPTAELEDGSGQSGALRRYFGDLVDGERLEKEFEPFGRSCIALSQSLGVRLGALLHDALQPDEQEYINEFRGRFESCDLEALLGPAPPAGRGVKAARRA